MYRSNQNRPSQTVLFRLSQARRRRDDEHGLPVPRRLRAQGPPGLRQGQGRRQGRDGQAPRALRGLGAGGRRPHLEGDGLRRRRGRAPLRPAHPAHVAGHRHLPAPRGGPVDAHADGDPHRGDARPRRQVSPGEARPPHPHRGGRHRAPGARRGRRRAGGRLAAGFLFVSLLLVVV